MRSGGFATSSSLANRGAASAQRAERTVEAAVPGRAPWFFGIMLVLSVMEFVLHNLMPGQSATTFHVFDAALVIVVAIGPAEVVLLVFAAERVWAMLRDEAAATGEPAFTRRQMVAVAVLLIGAPVTLALWANQGLDRSPPIVQTLSVGAKWITHPRRSGPRYHVSISPDLRAPLPFFSFYGDGTQDLTLSLDDWARVDPGRSTLTLATHRGLFGFGWIEPGVTVNP